MLLLNLITARSCIIAEVSKVEMFLDGSEQREGKGAKLAG